MSSFNNNSNPAILSGEEGLEYIQSLSRTTGGGSARQHKLLLDPTQFLAIGGLDHIRVAAQGIKQALEKNSVSLNDTFDFFTNNGLSYIEDAYRKIHSITADTKLSPALVWERKHPEVRNQLTITSELMTSGSRRYYTIETRSHYVSGNVIVENGSHDLKAGVDRFNRLYVRNDGSYYFQKTIDSPQVEVYLADASIFDDCYAYVLSTGAVERYNEMLFNIPQATLEEASDHGKQMVFYTVYQQLMPYIQESITAVNAASEALVN